MPPRTFDHFSHHHLLTPDDVPDSYDGVALCGMCRRLVAANQSVYVCYDDGYMIHKTCGDSNLPQHILNHPFHDLRHRLTLVIRSSQNSSISTSTIAATACCCYCDELFHKDEPLYYACEQCPDFYMHPTCANIPLPTITTAAASIDKDHDGQLVQYVCHEKPMALLQVEEHDHDDRDGRHQGEKCFACRSFWSGLPAYCCVTKTCNKFLHKSCADKLPRRKQHPFHPQHPLTLKVSKPTSCDSCCRKGFMLFFTCVEDGCNNGSINLCTECAFLEKNINCQSHDHFLSLVENFAVANGHHGNIRCDACQKDQEKCAEVDATQTYLFRCMECDFNHHFLCGPLPKTLKYEYHIHPLTLVDHKVTKDDSDEYYCDACEKERHPQCRLYYCASCKYNAHIHCLIHEIMKVIKVKGDTHENVELCALGENRWSSFHVENSVSGQHGIMESTFRDFMNSLSEREKQILTNFFDLDSLGDCHNEPEYETEDEDEDGDEDEDEDGDEDEDEDGDGDGDKDGDGNRAAVIRTAYTYLREHNSRFEHEGSVEDIDWIQQLFRFDSHDFLYLNRELILFKGSEGLKVDEKYLRQKVIEVGGYMVPNTLAPILQTLLINHGGDLGGKPNLTSGMKSVAATVICAVIDGMRWTNVEDITKDVLTRWYSDLRGAIKIAGFKKIIHRHSFKRLVMQAFPGLKAIRIKKDISEKLQRGIAELKAKLKIYEENQEKLEKYESEASDFMKKSLRRAEKLKGKKVVDMWFSN